jgi:hypothetical protein
MTFTEPFVVWPAPGSPAILEAGEDQFSVIVAHQCRTREDLKRWAEQLELQGKNTQITIPLDVGCVETLDSSRLESRARGFAAVLDTADVSYARIGLQTSRVHRAASRRGVDLYDLTVYRTLAKSRAVAFFGDRQQQLSLAFASDLHVATFWDEIADVVRRHAPRWLPEVADPTQMLRRFIKDANALCDRGELDLIVLGGDLVEYVHTQRRRKLGDCRTATNVHYLVKMLDQLSVPTIAVPGNHDHRLFPWRPRASRLQAIGLPAARARHLLKSSGHGDKRFPHRDDVNALRTVDDAGRPALAHHLSLLAPATDFFVNLRGLRLVFASTGADAIARWRTTKANRFGSLIRSLPTAWTHPDSEGLYGDQVRQLAKSLQGASGAAVFFHAPLLHARSNGRVEDRMGRMNLEAFGGPGSLGALEHDLRRAGLRQGVCFRNLGMVIRELLATQCPLVTFSGHVHRATAIELDRLTLDLQSVAMRPPARAERVISLLTGPALGQLSEGDDGLPGYLLCRFDKGELASLDRRVLPLGP